MRKEPRFCKWDEKPIPDDKRIDAIYCSSQCGANCRNEKNREKEAVLKINDARRRINIIIIKLLTFQGISKP